MLEFKKLCEEYENLTSAQRAVILSQKAVKITTAIKRIGIDGIDPTETLAGFIIGSVVADGRVDEKEYLLMYASLVKIFGYGFDFYSIKHSFRGLITSRHRINAYTENLLKIMSFLDEDLKNDVVTLCLCVTSTDGKINQKEKRYVKRLCKA